MHLVDCQFGPWHCPSFRRARNNVDAGGMWWPEWYATVGPFQFRFWGKPR
jgi:hypothetical protein